MDRRMDQNKLMLNSAKDNAQLDILVENTGRINFGPNIATERIGILGNAYWNNKPMKGWEIYSLPMKAPESLAFSAQPCAGPCFYRATMQLAKPVDTYLDTRELHKGSVWINGHALGRFWDIGPQGALYVPASWLRKGPNDIVIFDLDASPGRSIRGLDHPIVNFQQSQSKQ